MRKARVNFVLAVIIHHQRFGNSLSLVITDLSPIGLHCPNIPRSEDVPGVAVNFRRRRLQYAGSHAFRQAQHVYGSHHARLDCLYWIVLIMHRRCRTGQVVDLIHFQKDRLNHIVANQFEDVVEQLTMFTRRPVKKLSRQRTSCPLQ